MKLLEINTGIYNDDEMAVVYDLMKTALSLGYTHILDHFNFVDEELPLQEVVDTFNELFGVGELWSDLDEATKVDIGCVALTWTTYPIKSKVVYRPLTTEEAIALPDFFKSRITPIDGCVLYFQEGYSVTMERRAHNGKHKYTTKVFNN